MVGVRPAGAAGPTLDVTPETPEQDQGTQVTFTAAVSPAQGGLDIDFELFGNSPNDPDAGFFAPADKHCTTGTDGKCSITIPDTVAKPDEKDTVRAWIDKDNVDNTVE